MYVKVYFSRKTAFGSVIFIILQEKVARPLKIKADAWTLSHLTLAKLIESGITDDIS